jgi:hypothetical protein
MAQYSELHFNSAVFSDKVKYRGTRSRRILELNNPLHISKFHVKDLELPLFWVNLRKAGTATITWGFTNNGLFTTVLDFPAGVYNSTNFIEKFELDFRNATFVDVNTIGGTSLAQVHALADTISVGLDQFESRMRFVVDWSAFVSNAVTYTPIYLAVTWSETLRPFFSRLFDSQNDPLSQVTTNGTWISMYPMRFVPNYVYLHSNLMAATPYSSICRALGSFASRTIVTKIPIDDNYDWQQDIMPWTNPALDTAFMFDCGGTEFSELEFWFTDESGEELDFQNVQFSLTLAVLHEPLYRAGRAPYYG